MNHATSHCSSGDTKHLPARDVENGLALLHVLQVRLRHECTDWIRKFV